jgi:hypothetical protein
MLGAYVVLLVLGLPTAEFLALIVGPTLSVVVGFVLAGRISRVRQLLNTQHRETVIVLSDQNVQVTRLAEFVAAAVLPPSGSATDPPPAQAESSSVPAPPPGNRQSQPPT